MRTRLTKVDWAIINEALAKLEAEEDEDDRPASFWRRVSKTRTKVHERRAS